MDLRKLLEERANLIKQARAIIDAAEAENRDLTQEETNQYDTLIEEVNALQARVDRAQRQMEIESDLDQPAGDDAPIHTRTDPAGNGNGQPGQDQANEQERRYQAFQRFLPYWASQDFRGLSRTEHRALQADLDVSGGYLQPPEQFVNQLIKDVDDMVFIRSLATTHTVINADSMGVPTLDTDPEDADWTSELATGDETTMEFGKRELHPHPLAKRIKISRKLIRAVPSSATLVRNRLAYKFGITQEKAFLTGNGSQQPLGVFVASSDGISTGRDVSSGNTTTAIKFDGLKSAKYTLKGQYWPRVRWIFHRDAVGQLAKEKDGEGQYIWEESVKIGEPDRLLNFPVMMSEYVPNTFTTGLYVGILGDFAHYWIADALSFEIQLLIELYAETNQIGLIGRLESDGMPILEEAFARIQLA